MSPAWIFIFVIGLCHGVSKAADCTERGRFPNDLLEDCRGYTTCIGAVPTLYQYDLPCPQTFVYSHLDNQCTNSSSYRCYPEHTCSSIGNFANPNNFDCSSYFACVQGLSSIVTARLVECPKNSVFSPIANACVQTELYDCIQVTATSSSASILNLTEPTTVLIEVEKPPVNNSETPVKKEKNGAIRINVSHFTCLVLTAGILAFNF